ncbi:hypothetical protein TRAPUB_12895 [Trametes pubescens]|uniref:SH3 domain-containing protein n=1 Tax=Trametes pubescens TaxID=154538 RepID=A0A1M2VSP6_TRAPU|nr:hypothetical protein TRAPUB_12895 [Trametes pubescens]
MDLWTFLGYKQTPLRSANWVYLFVLDVWNYLKTLLIAYHDEQPPRPAPRRLPNTAPSQPEPSMASIVAQESSDLRLALPVEKVSPSPFPSPGSPFYPPPRLGAHEFASRPSSSSSSKSIARGVNDMALTNGESTPTTASIPQPALSVGTSLPSPATPTPNNVFQLKTPTTQITVPDPPSDADSAPVPLVASALTSQNRDSLTSSRPAPPSPAASRRTSAALSRHSSTVRSNRQSKSSLLQTAHEPEASSSSTTTVTPTAQPKRCSLLFKIRDFAYDTADDRHFGRGPDVPRANRPRQRWSTYSTASSSSAASSHADGDDEDTGEDARGSWGAYRWNTLSTHFSWGEGQGPADAAEAPSKTDFERNFDVSSPTDESGNPYQQEEFEDAYEGEGEGDADDGPLAPGLYRALYAFEPEGTAEMALEEEQIVHVLGRGGGVGWAIVEREGGGHALVPESYLELMEAD